MLTPTSPASRYYTTFIVLHNQRCLIMTTEEAYKRWYGRSRFSSTSYFQPIVLISPRPSLAQNVFQASHLPLFNNCCLRSDLCECSSINAEWYYQMVPMPPEWHGTSLLRHLDCTIGLLGSYVEQNTRTFASQSQRCKAAEEGKYPP